MKKLIAAFLLTGLASALTLSHAVAQEIVPAQKTQMPRLIREVKPRYTPEARKNKISGRVELECVVLTDGTPSEIRVTTGLDPGLDAEAIKALEQWRFKPGEKDGQPAPVKVTIEMTFTLRDKSSGLPAEQPATDAVVQTPQSAASDALLPSGVYKPGNGVSNPVVLHGPHPRYSAAAMRARVQGGVELRIIVLADGTVGDVRVSTSLDPDLDQESIDTVKKWKFKPGTKDGQPVAVEVSIEMAFTLK